MCWFCCKVFLRRVVSVHPQWKSSVRHLSVSAVTTTAAFTATSCVTLLMTAVTALMKDKKTVSVVVCSWWSHLSAQSYVIFCFSYLNYMHLQHLLSWYVSLRLGQNPTHGPCTDDEYKCSNGQCIPLQYACDDYDDCGDQSDELGCREYINQEHISNDDELRNSWYHSVQHKYLI